MMHTSTLRAPTAARGRTIVPIRPRKLVVVASVDWSLKGSSGEGERARREGSSVCVWRACRAVFDTLLRLDFEALLRLYTDPSTNTMLKNSPRSRALTPLLLHVARRRRHQRTPSPVTPLLLPSLNAAATHVLRRLLHTHA